MSKFTIETVGAKELEAALAEADKRARNAVGRIVRASALSIQADAVKLIQRGEKTGVVYTKRGGTKHQASAPGEAPASDEGTLAGRIVAVKIAPFSWAVGVSNLDYGAYLEFGTQHIAERPWLRPAAEFNRKPFVDDIRKALGIAL